MVCDHGQECLGPAPEAAVAFGQGAARALALRVVRPSRNYKLKTKTDRSVGLALSSKFGDFRDIAPAALQNCRESPAVSTPDMRSGPAPGPTPHVALIAPNLLLIRPDRPVVPVWPRPSRSPKSSRNNIFRRGKAVVSTCCGQRCLQARPYSLVFIKARSRDPAITKAKARLGRRALHTGDEAGDSIPGRTEPPRHR